MSESKEQKEQFETAEMPQVENKDSGKIDVMVELLQRKEDLQGSIENYLRDFGNCLQGFNLPNQEQEAKQKEIDELTSRINDIKTEREDLEKQIIHTRDRLEAEKEKPFFSRVFRGKNRQALIGKTAGLESERLLLSEAPFIFKKSIAERQKEELAQKEKQARLAEIRNVLAQAKKAQLDFAKQIGDNEEYRALLNEELIKIKILPGLQKLQDEAVVSKEQADEYVGLIKTELQRDKKAFFYLSPEERTADEEEVKKIREKFSELEKMSNYQLSSLNHKVDLYSELGTLGGNLREVKDDAYNQVFDCLCREEGLRVTQDFYSVAQSASIKPELALEIENIIKDVETPTDPYTKKIASDWQIESKPELIPLDIEKISPETLEKIFPDAALNRWEVLKENDKIKRLFSQEDINNLQEKLSKKTLNGLLNSPSHTQNSISAGNRLLKLKTIEAMPFIIVNCWREPGFSGEMPFLNVNSQSQETKAYEIIASLTSKEIEALKNKNIPGLIDVLRLVKANPKTFNLPYVESPGKGKQQYIENPVYIEIQKHLAELGLYLFKEGNASEQFFSIDLLRQLRDIEYSQEGYKLIGEAFKQAQNQETQQALLDLVHYRYSDLKIAQAAIDVFSELDKKMQDEIKKIAPDLLGRYLSKEDIARKDIEKIARILEKDTNDILLALDFIKQTDSIQEFGWGSHYKPENLDAFIGLSKHEGMIDFLKELSQYEYGFTVRHADVLPDLLENKKGVINDLKNIKEIFSDFKYSLLPEKYNQEKQESQTFWQTNPYLILTKTKPVAQVCEQLFVAQENNKEAPSKDFFKGLFFAYVSDKEKTTSGDIESFSDSLQKTMQEVLSQEGSLKPQQDFYLNNNFLTFLANRKDKKDISFMSWPKNYPNFFENLNYGGIFFANKENIAREFLASDEPEKEMLFADRVCSKALPYWKFLFFWTDRVKLKQALKSSVSVYPITNIAGVPLENIIKRHLAEKNKGKPTRLERIIEDKKIIQQLEGGEIKAVPFCKLRGGYKRLVFRYYLKEILNRSQDNILKQECDKRNKQEVKDKLDFQPGDFVHGSAVDNIEPFLHWGNLPKEALGEKAQVDSYPFHSDFSYLTEQYLLAKSGDVKNILEGSRSENYGQTGSLGADGQVFYLYKREKADWEKGKSYFAGSESGHPIENHALMLGGMPSSEISAIILRNPDKTIERVKEAILDNGFYTPLYDLGGNLLFLASDYEKARDDLNMRVPVEHWGEACFETGGQLGSNPGCQMVVPGQKGPEKYYVKFRYPESPQQIWVEKLTEDIYKELGVSVPETKIVYLQRRNVYGHASLMLEGEHKNPEDVKKLSSFQNGFIADCLMANWDIPYALERNVFVAKNNEMYRIDNGGALMYRARGQEKGANFGAEVLEIKRGDNKERLGQGMLQEYPGLTKKEIKQQVAVMENNLTDEVIDNLVDRARLPRQTRDNLKSLLKARRDYIIEYYRAA